MKNFENLSIRDYFSILRRRIWYAIGTATLVGLATLVYVSKMQPSFISETTIFVAGRLVPENYVESIVRETNPERIEFVRQQLQSRTFIERIVHEFQLANNPGADLETIINIFRARTQLTPLTATAFRLSFTASDPNLAQAVTRRLADRVIQLNENFRKEKVYGTDQFMDEQFRQASEQLSNAEEKLRKFYSQNFPGVPRDGISLDSLTSLQAQLVTADINLQNLTDKRKGIERRIEDQRQLKSVVRAQPAPTVAPAPVVTETEPPVRPPTVLEAKLAAKRLELNEKSVRYTSIHPEIITLTQEVKDLEAAVNQERVRTARTDNPRLPVANTTRSPQVVLPQIETSDFTQAELQFELDRVNRDLAAAQEVKRQFAAKMALYQSRMNPPAELAQQLSALNRDYDVAKQQYTDISSRKSKSALASDADTSGDNQVFKIVDEPNLPRHSTGPTRTMVLAGGAFMGLLLGLGAAFGRELLDTSVLDEEQAANDLKLAVLTSVPEVRSTKPKPQKNESTKQLKNGMMLLDLEKKTPGQRFELEDVDDRVREVLGNSITLAGEQFRLLRAKLSVMQKTVGMRSVMVTSAAPNEGKTFSAICLAGIIAQEPGKRVLLIDADLRSANAGKVLGVGRGKLGLASLLRSESPIVADSLESVVTKCSVGNWYFLPTGPAVSNPAELLSTPVFEALLRVANRQFDWVVVDTPPVLAVSDANLLTSICDGTLFVMHAGRTPLDHVKEAIGRIGPERICGLVMNRVRHLKTNHYYSSYYQKQTSAS